MLGQGRCSLEDIMRALQSRAAMHMTALSHSVTCSCRLLVPNNAVDAAVVIAGDLLPGARAVGATQSTLVAGGKTTWV